MKWYEWLMLILIVGVAGSIGYGMYQEHFVEPDLVEVEVSAEDRKAAREGLQEYRDLLDERGTYKYRETEDVDYLRELLEKDPTNTELRLKTVETIQSFPLAGVSYEREMTPDEETREVLEEGLELKLPDEERMDLMKAAALYTPEALGVETQSEAYRLIHETYPATRWAIDRKLSAARARAREGDPEALEIIEEQEPHIRDRAEREGRDVERDMKYLDYLRARYYAEIGDYEQSADLFYNVLIYLLNLPGRDDGVTPGLNLARGASWGEILRSGLPVLEQAERWEEIKEIIYTYQEDRVSWPTRLQELREKVYKNLEESQ